MHVMSRSIKGLQWVAAAALLGVSAVSMQAQGKPIAGENTDFTHSLNKPDRTEWFRDQGFGLFIHWSVDSQLGVTISHSLVGSSKDYQDKFFNDLQKTFDPKQFDPQEWAQLARLGARAFRAAEPVHRPAAPID